MHPRSRSPRLPLTLLALVLVWLATLPTAAGEPVRGMTISCQTDGREWAAPELDETLAELRRLGVNWVAIHPYGWIRANGQVRPYTPRGLSADWLRRPIEAAQRQGLKILIKPHLGYWGSPFSWRGAIRFDDDEAWQRFFSSYESWIAGLAEASRGADAFAVGTELGGTTEHEEAWRRIIASVRQRTGEMPLTYAANWDRFEAVGFWDALDAIGIQAYFPLVPHERPPEAGELDAAWGRLGQRLARFSKRWQRPLVFTELGYDLSPSAAARPWERGRQGPGAEEAQRRSLHAALRAVEAHPDVVGVFLWKWFVGDARGEDFLMSTPSMRAAIATRWHAPDTGRTGRR